MQPGPAPASEPEARTHLLGALAGLELRLRQAWSREADAVPAALRRYQGAWLRTLARPQHPRRAEDLGQALRQADPILVGDFHPLRRGPRQLARLIESLPADRPVALLVELLPRSPLQPARAACNADLRLADGRRLGTAYAPALEALAGRGGLIAGAWEAGSPCQRDRAAARTWSRLQRERPGLRWLLHFGDWHLADAHLPRHLRRSGARPLVLHISPEPLWERVAPPAQDVVLELGDGHWAWLDTPPLVLWASALQARCGGDPEETAELAEHLAESLAGSLSEVLRLPQPSGRTSVWCAAAWSEFHQQLPPSERAALSPIHAPRIAIFHPERAAVWVDRIPTLNSLIEAAAHLLVTEQQHALATGWRGQVQRRAFRRLCASLLNPYLRPLRLPDLATRLFPGLEAGWREREARELERVLAEGRWRPLAPRQRLLALEGLGAHVGAALAADQRLGYEFLMDFLDEGMAGLKWSQLAATIRAA